MSNTTVDLKKHRSEGSRVFTGRERGRKVRIAERLDVLDRQQGVVHILIPTDTLSVNSSFFLGMFGPSVRTLKEDGFRRKYEFQGKNIDKVIRDGIREALNESSPLSAESA